MTGERGKYVLRINGRGNAWPLPIGQEHPFYGSGPVPDYANTSFSVMAVSETGDIRSDILIDAGHGIVPFLLKHGNRLPEAIVITHPHFDHILGMDWIIQSYYRFHDKQPYPVYATVGCWQQILRVLPHLDGLVTFHELAYDRPTSVKESVGTTITAFPVYHGPHAHGAAMLLFDIQPAGKNILFTGDVLIPLICESDLEKLQYVNWLIVDANNRFPYPVTNHWSVARKEPEDGKYIASWLEGLTEDILMWPHNFQSYSNYQYILDFFRDFPEKKDYFLTALDFVKKLRPQHLILSHYSGIEDQRYYRQELLNDYSLEQWAKQIINEKGLTVEVQVPETGEKISLGRMAIRPDGK